MALGLESPAYAAAETRVALEDAEAEADETPSVEVASGLAPAPGELGATLAEAEAASPGAPTVIGSGGLAPVSAGGEAELAEAEVQPSISTRGGQPPIDAESSAPLAEAEPSSGPEAIAATGKAPEGPADAGLAEASEQRPETAPYVGAPDEAPEEYVVTLEPASPRPPVAKEPTGEAPVDKAPEKPIAPAGPEPARAASAVTASAVTANPLEKGRYYIQIGAFATQAAASENVAGLRGGFPTLIQRSGVPGKETWRVFVGPLSRDESGVALVRVRALGYKDAFVKSGS